MRINFNSNNTSIRQGNNSSILSLNLKNEVAIDNLCLASISIPYSFYNVNKYNNTLYISIGVVDHFPITIEPGNYNAYQLIEYVNEAVKVHDADCIFSYDSIKNKFRYEFTGTGYFKIHFRLNSYVLFGSEYDEIIEMNPTTPVVYSKNIVQMNYTNNIIIRSNISNGNIIYNNNYTNYMAVIPINCSPNQLITYSNYSSDFWIDVHKNVSYIELELVNDWGEVVDLNQGNWCGEFAFS